MRSTVRYCFPVVVTLVIMLRLFPAGAAEQQRASTTNNSTATVVRLDPRFDTLVPREPRCSWPRTRVPVLPEY
jgi:hypothetical protein